MPSGQQLRRLRICRLRRPGGGHRQRRSPGERLSGRRRFGGWEDRRYHGRGGWSRRPEGGICQMCRNLRYCTEKLWVYRCRGLPVCQHDAERRRQDLYVRLSGLRRLRNGVSVWCDPHCERCGGCGSGRMQGLREMRGRMSEEAHRTGAGRGRTLCTV